jgi:ankyrin repeat protein
VLDPYSPRRERSIARSQKVADAIRALLAAGLKVTNRAEGARAINVARNAGQTDLVDLLADAGAKLDKP